LAQAHLNKNYFAQLLATKTHVCDYTATRNKAEPSLDSVLNDASVTAAAPWTDTSFPADDTSLFWSDAGESFSEASDVE
jgi:hypothetical protein